MLCLVYLSLVITCTATYVPESLHYGDKSSNIYTIDKGQPNRYHVYDNSPTYSPEILTGYEELTHFPHVYTSRIHKMPYYGPYNHVSLEHSTQHHSQDPYGGYKYGYKNNLSEKSEQSDKNGVITGQYSYVDPNGKQQHVKYTADHNGFRVQGTNLPQDNQASRVVQDTYEVKMAKAKFEKLYSKASTAAESAGYGQYYSVGNIHGKRYKRSLPIPVEDTPEVRSAKILQAYLYEKAAMAAAKSHDYSNGLYKDSFYEPVRYNYDTKRKIIPFYMPTNSKHNDVKLAHAYKNQNNYYYPKNLHYPDHGSGFSYAFTSIHSVPVNHAVLKTHKY